MVVEFFWKILMMMALAAEAPLEGLVKDIQWLFIEMKNSFKNPQVQSLAINPCQVRKLDELAWVRAAPR